MNLKYNLSSTVQGALDKLSKMETISSIDFAKEILKNHGEYSNNSANVMLKKLNNIGKKMLKREVSWYLKSGEENKKILLYSANEWIDEVVTLYQTLKLHGRIFIIGLCILDKTLRDILSENNFLNNLISELKEDIRNILSPEGLNLFNSTIAWKKENNTTEHVDEQPDNARLLKVGKIIFRQGDMFDNETLEETNIIILPASSSGTATENILQKAVELGIPYPPSNPISGILLYSGHLNNRLIHVGYAYSVTENQTSNSQIISNVCKALISTISSEEFSSSKINLPLLGTGAGGVDPVEVASIYDKEFNNNNNSALNFLVSIRDKDVFEKIKALFQSSSHKMKAEPDIKSRLHSDTFDLDEADVLNYDLIAENLFTILTNKDTNPPLNIGIIAPWGRGKTSLMKRIKKRFDEKRSNDFANQQIHKKINFSIRNIEKWMQNKFVDQVYSIPSIRTLINWLKTDKIEINFNVPYATVWFNPWNYQSSEMIWGGLAYSLIEQVVSQIPTSAERELFRLQLRLARMDKEELRRDIQNYFIQLVASMLLFGTISIIFFILFFTKNYNPLFGLPGALSLIGTFSSIYKFTHRNSQSLIKKLDKYDKPLQYLNKLGTFHEVESDLKKVFEYLIQKEKPLVVFVDDLDRCSPSKVVEVVEAINVFINSDAYKDKCYFILGMDAEMVAAALDVSYEKMKGKMGSKELEQGSIGWYFLDKFIQLPFFIPVMSETKKKEYLDYLLTEKVDENNGTSTNTKPDQKKIEQVFNEVISTNNNQQSAEAIKKASLTVDEEKELDKKILKHQVESTKQNEEIKKQVAAYAQFINSDPRSLKRFTNLLRFYSSYQVIRMKRNKSYVEIKVLAKWLAIMVKFPQLVRWIQWDSENKSGINTAAEDKANMLDGLINDLIKLKLTDSDFDKWLQLEFYLDGTPSKIEDLKDMPWLQSRNLFKIMRSELSEGAKFKNALDCNVW